MGTTRRLSFWSLWGRGWVAFFSIGPMVWFCVDWLPRQLEWLFGGATSPTWKALEFAIRAALFLLLFPWFIGVGVEVSYPRLLTALWGRPEAEDTPRADAGGDDRPPRHGAMG